MFRLVKQTAFKVNSGPFSNKSPLNHCQNGTVYCTACERPISNKTNGNITQRNQSSFTNTKVSIVENLPKKKKLNKKYKYTELLQVNKDSSNEIKAIVKKLTGKQLSLLAESPEITLEHLGKLKKKSNSKKKFIDKEKLSTDNEFNEKCATVLNETNNHEYNEKYAEIFNKIDNSYIRKTVTLPVNNILKEGNIKKRTDNDFNEKRAAVLNKTNNYDYNKKYAEIFNKIDNSYIRKTVTLPVNNILKEGNMNQLGLSDSTLKSETTSPHRSEDRRKEDLTIDGKSKKKTKVKNLTMMMQMEQDGLQKRFNQSLSSYIDICVNCGYLNRAYGTLENYHNRTKQNVKHYKLLDISPFNTLMHGFANKGILEKIKNLLQIIQDCNIKPSPQTYAACFECFAHLPDNDYNLFEMKLYYNEMKENGYTANDLFTQCTYTADQRNLLLKMIRKFEPKFVPQLQPPVLCYSCSLLQDLNISKMNKSFKSPAENLFTLSKLRQLAKEQIAIEMNSWITVKSVDRPKELTERILHYRTKWNEMKETWRMTIRESLARDLETMKKQQDFARKYYNINIFPYLRALPSEQYVDIILMEIQKLAQSSETYSPSLTTLWNSLGEQVRMKYQIKFKQSFGILQKTERLYNDYCEWYLNPKSNKEATNTRQSWQLLIYANSKSGPSMNVKEKMWSSTVSTEIGKFLYNIIIKDLKIDVNITKMTNTSPPQYMPVFYTLFRQQTKYMREELKPHPTFMHLYKEAALEEIQFDACMIPMTCPPLPWTSVNNGGYLITKTDFVRLNSIQSSMEQIHRLENTPHQKLYPIFDSLNQLSSIPWTVNEEVLDVVLEVFQNGGSQKLNIPQSPSMYKVCEADLPTLDKVSAQLELYHKKMMANKKKAEMYSLWCEALYQLSLANHFRGRVFWLPHNIDFRGRVYPVPPHLNHLGSDMARSILRFAKSEPLGPNGLDWLKIHCINLTGLKKRNPINERLAYANELLPDILDSAENPLKGKMWWAESDEPWQTLACCKEIKNALDSGDPVNYLSKFPIHQDGSCNGLQHYAALGRDESGAQSVNLVPSDSPQDVYSCVVSLVEKERMKDAANGNQTAKALEGFIKRKVIKQTVMTTVYGVTKYGARLQIAKQLNDIDSFPSSNVWAASLYLVEKTFYCLTEMFSSTKEIQNWFTNCARTVSQVCKKNMEWETTLGLPIIQPYIKRKKLPIKSCSDGTVMEHFPTDMTEHPVVIKQANAFPPNFVHSLDSTHMMLTSLYCEREGITFVSVHDCYWTHPSTVHIMNEICRKQFVRLHSEPILENLSSYILDRFSPKSDDDGKQYKNAKISSALEIVKHVPEKGSYDLNDVLNSVYFFS